MDACQAKMLERVGNRDAAECHVITSHVYVEHAAWCASPSCAMLAPAPHKHLHLVTEHLPSQDDVARTMKEQERKRRERNEEEIKKRIVPATP